LSTHERIGDKLAARMLCILVTGLVSLLTCRAFNANAQTETNLHLFTGGPNDGERPYAALVRGSDGNFYGTTPQGGTNKCNCGTVFQISPSGSYTTLYSFVGSPNDGSTPLAGLVQGSGGNFYGTTLSGGTNSCHCGTIFRISPSGSYATLYSFAGSPGDGGFPEAGLVQGSDGNLYGTASDGGTNSCNCGTVFRISPSGTCTTLYSFGSQPNDGSAPLAGLVQGSDSNFYGTASYGGTHNGGTVYRIAPSGTYTTLYSFAVSPNDGDQPDAGLVQGSDGNFYGTTLEGGTNNDGIVFRISPTGSLTNLHTFSGYPNDGDQPLAGLVQGSDGNFYGTTWLGGADEGGTIFRISPNGSFVNLYAFPNYANDGAGPVGGLVQGSNGNFYGTTQDGGINDIPNGGGGTVFKLTVPLNPPANQISGVQVTGDDVVISVPSVAGETYQLQFTADLTSGNWSNVANVSVTNCIGALMTLTNLGGALLPQGFYRFDITP
jgi:uncharacterized repeat protein (TIGR03803 family)